MSKRLHQICREKVATNLLAKVSDMTPEEVSSEYWSDLLNQADSLLDQVSEAGLMVIPVYTDPFPHDHEQSISVMDDTVVLEGKQETYLNKGQLLHLIQDLVISMNMINEDAAQFVRMAG